QERNGQCEAVETRTPCSPASRARRVDPRLRLVLRGEAALENGAASALGRETLGDEGLNSPLRLRRSIICRTRPRRMRRGHQTMKRWRHAVHGPELPGE